jgi:heptosyltransferase-1
MKASEQPDSMTKPQILILRTSAIGDVIMSSHLAEGMRSKYPDAHICWLAEPQVIALLEHNPFLDSVLVFPKTHWKTLLKEKKLLQLYRELSAFVRKLHMVKFDIAIDAQGLLRTRLLAWLSGAKERIGFTSREPGGFLMTQLVTDDDSNPVMGSEYFYLLQQLDIDTSKLSQKVYLDQEQHQEAENILHNAGISGDYITLAPFTTRPQKHWFEQRWIELAQKLTEKYRLPIVWLGGPDDAETAEKLALVGGGVSLAGKCSLDVSAAVVNAAKLLIGVDTGLTHLGSAFKIPVIALFGSTCPYTTTKNPKTAIIYHKLPCSPCRRNPACNNGFDCMQMISVDEVYKAASSLVDTGTDK